MTVAARLAAVLLLLWTLPAAAQSYPAKPMRIVDVYARLIGARVDTLVMSALLRLTRTSLI